MAEQVDSPAAMARVWINCCHDHSPDSGGDDCVCARRCAAVGRAWLERNVQDRAFLADSFGFCVAKGFDFCVWSASAFMPAFANEFPCLDKHCADHRVWRGPAPAFSCEAQGKAHPVHVTGVLPGIEVFDVPCCFVRFGEPSQIICLFKTFDCRGVSRQSFLLPRATNSPKPLRRNGLAFRGLAAPRCGDDELFRIARSRGNEGFPATAVQRTAIRLR